jgi:hypothetical protein
MPKQIKTIIDLELFKFIGYMRKNFREKIFFIHFLNENEIENHSQLDKIVIK